MESTQGKISGCAIKHPERLYTETEIKRLPSIFVSTDGEVYLRDKRVYDNGGYQIDGFVKSKRGIGYHYLWVNADRSNNILGKNSSCGCEAARYYGNPCNHMLKLRNVAVKNREKIDSVVGEVKSLRIRRQEEWAERERQLHRQA